MRLFGAPSSAKLSLPTVTLAVIDTIYHDLTALAVEECLRHADFGDVVTLSDRPIAGRHVKVERAKGLDDIAGLTITRLPYEISTSHFLIAQWDGWIVNPAAWSREFLEYDYIGAPWPWYRDGLAVGNGGFSLRSTKLARYAATKYAPRAPEDELLCRRHRRELEAQGFRWAPVALAARFSFERCQPRPSFGFHGDFNFRHVLSVADEARRLAMKRKCAA